MFELIDKKSGIAATLISFSVNIRITGLLSETICDLEFKNETENDIEDGELQFPLPQNGTVCGYSVDVNGKMVKKIKKVFVQK